MGRGRGPERETFVVRLVTIVLGTALVVSTWVAPGHGTEPHRALRLFEHAPLVRVRLTRVGDGPWRISAAAGLAVRVETPDGFGEVQLDRVVVGARDGELVVDGVPCGPRVSIVPRGGALEIEGTAYSGRLEIIAARGPRLILSLPLEHYVACVLPGEMPMSYPREALRAQAIAARTYAVATLLARRSKLWDVVDNEASQVFQGETTWSRGRAREIVEETSRLVLTWDERPFLAFYSATCGGQTRGNDEAFGEEPVAPLEGTKCGFCDWASDSTWHLSVELARLARELDLRTPIQGARVRAAPHGHGAVVEVETSRGIVPVKTSELRRALGRRRLRSTWVTDAEIVGDRLELGGRGHGHGVGLCQNGARGLAETGGTARTILEQYYRGAALARLDW